MSPPPQTSAPWAAVQKRYSGGKAIKGGDVSGALVLLLLMGGGERVAAGPPHVRPPPADLGSAVSSRCQVYDGQHAQAIQSDAPAWRGLPYPWQPCTEVVLKR